MNRALHDIEVQNEYMLSQFSDYVKWEVSLALVRFLTLLRAGNHISLDLSKSRLLTHSAPLYSYRLVTASEIGFPLTQSRY